MKTPKFFKLILAASLTLVAAAPLGAAELGMQAPDLSITHWVKNGPVNLKEGRGKKIYVVEMWATW